MKLGEELKMKKLTLAAVIGSIGIAGIVALSNTGAVAQIPQPTNPPATATNCVDADCIALYRDGGPLFERNCSGCHGHNGEGIVGPELAGNPFVGSNSAIINQILEGNTDHGMPPFRGNLTAPQIAAIATYVRNSWGNDFGITSEETVNNNL